MYELANVDSATSEAMLKDAVSEGFSVLRFWAFEPLEKNKLKEICDISKELNLKVIPVLADTWGYLQNYKIDDEWYRTGYKKNYLNYVKDITTAFKDRDEIILWELINEPVNNSFSEMYNFAEDASKTIKESDPNHLISIGTIGGIGDKFGDQFSRFNVANFEKLYSIKTLDAISIHDYSFNSTVLERLDILYRLKGKANSADNFRKIDAMINSILQSVDKYTLERFKRTYDFPLSLRYIWNSYNKKNIQIAKKLNKPIYIGEVGFKKSMKEYRKLILEQELKRYFNEGIAGVLLWSFESQGKSVDGHDYGFGVDDGFGEVVKKLKINK
ncbi:MAG: cellulase family glycosylhydrolase [Ignavibacteria bacterium]|nr:cellulase family glycosylhydrolase [Ignavibacteria bacterium]